MQVAYCVYSFTHKRRYYPPCPIIQHSTEPIGDTSGVSSQGIFMLVREVFTRVRRFMSPVTMKSNPNYNCGV
jgi:hypothetical protein